VVIALLVTAVVSVVYISNIIAVGQLVMRIGDLETRRQRLLNEQEVLRAQVNRMSSLERIRQMAETDLGLKNSDALPGWLTVSPERVREIEAAMKDVRERP
jgi:cell division protein FtsL